MPELPEVETVCRGLSAALAGRVLVNVEQRRADLRFAFPERFAERLKGRRIERIGRRAKYILVFLDNDDVLLVHLGMSGRFTILERANTAPGRFYHRHDNQPGEPHVHVIFACDNATRVLYSDPRRFGFMMLEPAATLDDSRFLKSLGPEPLGPGFSQSYLSRALAGRKTTLKAALLDQRLIAGIGNIYACEALHRARLSPRRLAASAGSPRRATKRAGDLVEAVTTVLEEAIEAGGSTLRDFAHADGALGYFQHRFAVYDREGEPCPRRDCGGQIRRIVQAGRSTFFCPRCQR